MVAVELTSQNEFEQTIEAGVSLINFNAPWCSPCRDQDLILSDLKEDFSDLAIVGKVNIDQNQNIAYGLGIQSIPTIIIFREGREIDRFVGLQTAETLNKALKSALLLQPEA